ncbi:cobyrinate a,c-diamide synthase [Dongshaea marina]|uniref:cobyrinate a,c-diamide synthase n=1 Tax=Dongshaea marina TaxID=2047966 RepID=UPI000D3E498C|nr:cobyrinate a,c-diamide synthase [Dongshaea marina]
MQKTVFMICGTASGVGKTTVTQCILADLVSQGLRVQSFKLGPDYIDAGFHAKITGQPCINLDKYLLTPHGQEVQQQEILRRHFWGYFEENDALIVEAVGGIFDDWDNSDNSPYAQASMLGINIMLVADGFASTQTLGYMLQGLLQRDEEKRILGLLINKASSAQHYRKIIEPLSEPEQALCVGYLPSSAKLYINERHLGLVTQIERLVSGEDIREIACLYRETIAADYTHRFKIPQPALNLPGRKPTADTTQLQLKIAIARDQAFSFYYAYNLQHLESLGAELVYFSPLDDHTLPQGISALYLGGGFPEVHAKALSANQGMRRSIRQHAEQGLPIYAECGGLIYLGKTMQEYETGIIHEVVGLFDFSSQFAEKLTIGYSTGTMTRDNLIGRKGEKVKGHLFHKTEIKASNSLASSLELGGIDGRHRHLEGYFYKNVYASYQHLHFLGNPRVAERLMEAAKHYAATCSKISSRVDCPDT